MQRSSSSWLKEAVPDIRAEVFSNPEEILDQLPKLKEQTDYVVADGPGSNSEISRALLLRANIAIVPCKASMLEVRALAQATSVLRVVQEVRSGNPQATIVLSMVGKTYRLTGDMKDAAAALNLPLAEQVITQKQVVADAPGQKSLVWNLGARGYSSGREFQEVFREVLPWADSTRASKRREITAALSDQDLASVDVV